MDVKTLAKNIGKVGLTVWSPPIGLATFPKKLGEGFALFGVGVLLSAGLSGGVLSFPIEIYDNPPIKVDSFPSSSSSIAIGKGFMSPLAFYLDSYRGTVLESSDKRYVIRGEDVINFSDGKYNLDFSTGRDFSNLNLDDSEAMVKKTKKELSDCVSQGDIFCARSAKERVQEAESNLRNTRDAYHKTKSVFQDAVNKMNAELEGYSVD